MILLQVKNHQSIIVYVELFINLLILDKRVWNLELMSAVEIVTTVICDCLFLVDLELVWTNNQEGHILGQSCFVYGKVQTIIIIIFFNN